MDPRSPFSHLKEPTKIAPSKIVHINFCTACHYVWKAPTEAKICVNCIGNEETAISLISYESEVPRI